MSAAPICVLHCVPGLHVRDGGPSQSVVRLTDSLAADPGLRITLVTHSNPLHASIPSTNAAVTRKTASSSNQIALKSGLVDQSLVAAAAASQRFDLFHIHSLWHLSNHWAMRLAARRNIPLVCQPRGMLEPWALGHKAWKKRLALAAFHRTDMESVRAFIATSPMEGESIRRMGLRQPVAVIPNGVELPLPAPAPAPRDPARRRKALFLSRIHPIKGITLLVDAWAQANLPGWELVIAGPDTDGHLAAVLARIKSLGVGDRVSYVGELHGEEKAAAYRSADVFVLPSNGENFGLVIAEALTYGTPVITTRFTPWADLATHGCGWWIEGGREPLVEALRAAAALDDDERSRMGARGMEYVKRFQWANSARQTAELYRWILGRGERPAAVLDDGAQLAGAAR